VSDHPGLRSVYGEWWPGLAAWTSSSGVEGSRRARAVRRVASDRGRSIRPVASLARPV